MPNNVETWLANYVNSVNFSNKLECDIDLLEKPADRVRVRLELLSYVVPKVKGIDPMPTDTDRTIEVIFQEDKGNETRS